MFDPTLLAQAPPAPAPGGTTDLVGALGVGSIIAAVITAIGTQFKPVIEGYWADRKHKRELDALDMANDLAHASQRIRLLAEEVAYWKALAEHNQARLDQIEANWKNPDLPPAPPPPVPPASLSSDAIPVMPPPTPKPEAPAR